MARVEIISCSSDVVWLYHRYFGPINENNMPQLINLYLGTIGNGPQGEKLCSSEPNRVWIWEALSYRGSGEKCFELLGWYNNVLCC